MTILGARPLAHEKEQEAATGPERLHGWPQGQPQPKAHRVSYDRSVARERVAVTKNVDAGEDPVTSCSPTRGQRQYVLEGLQRMRPPRVGIYVLRRNSSRCPDVLEGGHRQRFSPKGHTKRYTVR